MKESDQAKRPPFTAGLSRTTVFEIIKNSMARQIKKNYN
jgi:hypothetical protein